MRFIAKLHEIVSVLLVKSSKSFPLVLFLLVLLFQRRGQTRSSSDKR